MIVLRVVSDAESIQRPETAQANAIFIWKQQPKAALRLQNGQLFIKTTDTHTQTHRKFNPKQAQGATSMQRVKNIFYSIKKGVKSSWLTSLYFICDIPQHS